MTESEIAFDHDFAALSDRGRVRQQNEDSVGAFPEFGVWVVADGMGGHAAGDVASRIIVEELGSTGVAISAQDQRARVLERLSRAHLRILNHSRDSGLGGAGSTVAALLLHGSELACVWAGDSRIYLMREGRLTPLTRDHSEVALLVAAGALTEDQARTAPRRNVITRAIGIGPTVEPDIASGVIKDGDRLLLCSDGLTEHLSDAEIAAFAGRSLSAEGVAQALINETLQRGARDNVSVILVDCLARPAPVEDAE
ncbi:PP2C family protein-serine/threonine phosphatase [Paracoccus lutimaris]|uniref:Protein phosphatase n=1 Tax=Paracoccus lutimaris TaxID=1490030 RepID=A0A368Z5K3_9RHOB|nr:protein phosphatase 2C domain-containing protein [Paracoccus lutimaris]RCW87058.1 protein phosphatase [Paracoccus lutimaris]